ncbi:MAG TPA: DUF1501 domain-containing protein [Thiothrix sp.]|nr:DUF1501 domain-containing protein [Thiothrix sp.]
MKRREFLRLVSLGACAGSLSSLSYAQALASTKQESRVEQIRRIKKDRILVLVELKGGNDGLNTLVPYTDPLYKKLRPTLSLSKNQVIDLGHGMGMHKSLAALKPIWDDEDLAWIQGVGYPRPDLSHFRSQDIWKTASSSDHQLTDGWLSLVLPEKKRGLHGIVIGDDLGPLESHHCRAVVMKDPKTFRQQANMVKVIRHKSNNASLAHLIGVQQQLHEAKMLLENTSGFAYLDRYFHAHPFQNDLKSVAKMIVGGGAKASVYKVTLKGFDTHASQAVTHKNQLKYLADGLNAFATAMKASDKWHDVLIMTYSEFGRSVKENRSGGTDHGTAAPHLVMGGKVNGGELYGENMRLNDLQDGDLVYTTDFRSLYATITDRWWGLESPWQQHDTLAFV